jgi:hypothetical protein
MLTNAASLSKILHPAMVQDKVAVNVSSKLIIGMLIAAKTKSSA